MKISIKIIEGDILLSKRDIIVQQVNAKGYMGAGLALQIMKRYPNVKKEYKDFINKHLSKGFTNEDLLGKVNLVDTYDGTIIANVFGQLEVRKGVNDTNTYTIPSKLLEGISIVKKIAEKLKLTVAIPTYIGCGLAGSDGDWEGIHAAIEEIFKDSIVDIQFYHYR